MVTTAMFMGRLHTVEADWDRPECPVLFNGTDSGHEAMDYYDRAYGAMRALLQDFASESLDTPQTDLPDWVRLQIERAIAAAV